MPEHMTTPLTNLIQKIKGLVKQARIQAMLKANTELIKLYFQIGKELAMNIETNQGKTNIVKQASKELVAEYGTGAGYGERNLKYMIKFYRQTGDDLEVHQLGALVPWKHLCLILDKCPSRQEKLFYLQQSIKNGYSRERLTLHIQNKAYENSKLEKLHNFDLTLPEDSHLTAEIVKSEYVLALVGADEYKKEKDLEKAILENLKDFLLELGEGFTFVGNQYKLQDQDNDYYVDLLFFNRKLNCLFAIELKLGEFQPEYISKMQYYLHLLDKQVKQPHENQTIGVILCSTKKDYMVKPLLEKTNSPIAVATYRIVEKIEKGLAKLLKKPTGIN